MTMLQKRRNVQSKSFFPLRQRRINSNSSNSNSNSSSNSNSNKLTKSILTKVVLVITIVSYLLFLSIAYLQRNESYNYNNNSNNNNDIDLSKEAIVENFLHSLQKQKNDKDSSSFSSSSLHSKSKKEEYTDAEIYKLIHHHHHPNRIQTLDQNHELIGQDGIENEYHKLENYTQVLYKKAQQHKQPQHLSHNQEKKNTNTNSNMNIPKDPIQEILNEFEIPSELLYHRRQLDEEATIESIISYLQLYLDTLDQLLYPFRTIPTTTTTAMNTTTNSTRPLPNDNATMALKSSTSSFIQNISQKMNKYQYWKLYSSFTEQTINNWDQETYQKDLYPQFTMIQSKLRSKSNSMSSSSAAAAGEKKTKNKNSIFVSIVSYKDDKRCYHTIEELYNQADNDGDLINVGLVYAPDDNNDDYGNVPTNSTSTTTKTKTMTNMDCYELICQSKGMEFCKRHIRKLQMKDTTSFSPYYARFFASKLWFGEDWYMQIDSHMHFDKGWDTTTISSIQENNKLHAGRAVITYMPYPVKNRNTTNNEDEVSTNTTTKQIPIICNGYFSKGPWDGQLIFLNTTIKKDDFGGNRLGNTNKGGNDSSGLTESPFAISGNLFTTSDVLQEVPFDPFLPFISKGENILMSSRMWTSGYVFYHPNQDSKVVLGHEYGSNQKAKSSTIATTTTTTTHWESEAEQILGHEGLYNPLKFFMTNRIKYLLQYPESARDMIQTKSLLFEIEKYGLGSLRTIEDYLKYAKLDVWTKTTLGNTIQCENQ